MRKKLLTLAVSAGVLVGIMGSVTPASATVVDESEWNIIIGSMDNDSITGTNQNDYIFGFAGDDALLGGKGDDVLRGQRGNDRIVGWGHNSGVDILWGGPGLRDICIGEAEDIFTPSCEISRVRLPL